MYRQVMSVYYIVILLGCWVSPPERFTGFGIKYGDRPATLSALKDFLIFVFQQTNLNSSNIFLSSSEPEFKWY